MKSNYKIILPIIVLAGILLSFNIKQKPDPEKDRVLLGLIRYALTQGHYQPQELNDDFSKAVYDDFIKSLDPTKRFFTQEDINAFSVFQDKIDDQIKNEDLTFYSTVYAKYAQRLQEAKGFYREILKYPFDFSKKETFDINYDNTPFAKNEIELIINWQKQLKAEHLIQALRQIRNRSRKEKRRSKLYREIIFRS